MAGLGDCLPLENSGFGGRQDVVGQNIPPRRQEEKRRAQDTGILS